MRHDLPTLTLLTPLLMLSNVWGCSVDDADDDATGGSGGSASSNAGGSGSTTRGNGGSTSGSGGSASGSAGQAGADAGSGGSGTGGSAGSVASGGSSTGGSSTGGSSTGGSSTGGTQGGNGGEAGATPVDNCPDHDNPEQLDTDDDGFGDVCDEDDDGDGFADVDDPAPLDAEIPGDFSSPEAILADPRVKAAIDAMAEAGYEFRAHTKLTPPDITGYYHHPRLGTNVVTTGDGSSLGNGIVAHERRFTVRDDTLIGSAVLEYEGNSPVGYSRGDGSFYRGDGTDFTIYSRAKYRCVAGLEMQYLDIMSGSVEEGSGALVDVASIKVTVADNGMQASGCNIVGDLEYEGGWAGTVTPVYTKIGTADLLYMCVDENAGYVPGENWTRADDTACECSSTFTVECE